MSNASVTGPPRVSVARSEAAGRAFVGGAGRRGVGSQAGSGCDRSTRTVHFPWADVGRPRRTTRGTAGLAAVRAKRQALYVPRRPGGSPQRPSPVRSGRFGCGEALSLILPEPARTVVLGQEPLRGAQSGAPRSGDRVVSGRSYAPHRWDTARAHAPCCP